MRNIYVSNIIANMGIVKLSEAMHENLRVASAALSRSINAQAEHWMRIGLLAELHPDLTHAQLCQLLIRSELGGGVDLARLASALPSASAATALSRAEAARIREAGAKARRASTTRRAA